MRFGVLQFPGSNCDQDCLRVIRHVMKEEALYLWHKDSDLHDVDCIIVPGGFSYGDYLRCGAIARFSPIMKEVKKFAESGGMVIGICNGFQILVEAGLLPGALLRNRSLKFRCETLYLRVENADTLFTCKTKKGQVLKIPIAHGEGNYFADADTLRQLKQNNQIAFSYCDAQGNVTDAVNPNGAIENIAGIISREGNVLGMMPHPERASEEILGSVDGRIIFESMIHSLKQRLVAR